MPRPDKLGLAMTLTGETPVLRFKGVDKYYMEVHMNNLYTAVTKKDGNWWIGWVTEIPGVNCQERTHKKLLETLKVTLKEALEFNRHDALMTVGNDYREEQIAI